MKNILMIISLMFCLAPLTAQEVKKDEIKSMIAIYVGKTYNEVYFKSEVDNKTIVFSLISIQAMTKYDLKTKSLLGRPFKVVYKTSLEEVSVGKDLKDKTATVKTIKKIHMLLDLENQSNLPVENSIGLN